VSFFYSQRIYPKYSQDGSNACFVRSFGSETVQGQENVTAKEASLLEGGTKAN